MRKLIAGNWKMNGSLAANQALVQALCAGVGTPDCDVVVCPPAAYLAQVQQLLAGCGAIALGAQDVSEQAGGAYTGNVSAAMLAEFGVRYVIVGHSERRQYQGESDLLVARKAQQALATGITPIVCVGETLAEREQGLTEFIVQRQLSAVMAVNAARLAEIVVAYEPVWAIGTGKTTTPEDAAEVHAALRAELVKMVGERGGAVPILYGGSVNRSNVEALIAVEDVDGVLVGGASLDAEQWLAIVRS